MEVKPESNDDTTVQQVTTHSHNICQRKNEPGFTNLFSPLPARSFVDLSGKLHSSGGK